MTLLTFEKLSILLETFYDVSVKPAGSEPPSDNLKKLYLEVLKDLDFETVNKNGFNHFKNNRYFPAACDLRAEITMNKILEAKADRAYRLTEHLMGEYYDPGFQQACMAVIVHEIETWEKVDPTIKELDLVAVIKRWGLEIWEKSNPSATRAQFLKSFLIENGEYYKLPEHKQREISDRAAGLISPIIKKMEDT